jgi:hypothetical protein
MLQINNLHATVGDKSTFRRFIPAIGLVAISLPGLSACGTAPRDSLDCKALATKRQHDVRQIMDDAAANNPSPKSVVSESYPALAENQKYLGVQARLQKIDANFPAQCRKVQ